MLDLTVTDKLNIRVCLKNEIHSEIRHIRNNRDLYGIDYVKSVISRLRELNHTLIKIKY